MGRTYASRCAHEVETVMKVIFLDIDGVLNHAGTEERYEGMLGIDRILLRRFYRVLKYSKAHVVLSSSWRYGPGWRERMKAAGLHCELLDKTPEFNGLTSRGSEVKEWLDLHPEVTQYAILDDNGDFLKGQPLFQTSCLKGLTSNLAGDVIKHFLKGDKVA